MGSNILKQQESIKIKYLFFFLIFLFSLYFLGVSPSLFLITSGIIASILFGWLIYREYKESPIKITPVLVLFIMPFLMLGVSAVYHGFVYFNQEYVPIGPKSTTTTSIVMGYIMIAIGLFFQFLGIIYFKPKSMFKNKYLELKSNVKLIPYFILFLIVSKFAEIYLKLGVMQHFLDLVPLSLLVFIAIKDKNNVSSSYSYKRNIIILGSIFLFLFSLISLSKTLIVFAILPIPLFYLIHARKFQTYKIIVIGSVISIAYFLFIQPLVSNAREALAPYTQKISISTLIDYISSGNYKYAMPGDIDYANYNTVEILLNRLFEVNAPAYIYDITKNTGFKYGKTFDKMAFAMVPRIFWSDKPNMTQGAKFAGEYFNQPQNNIGMLISGELYWNFGFIGIVIGSFILGLSMGYVWKLITPFAFKNFIYFSVYFFLLQSCLGGPEFSAVFMGILQLLIVFLLIRFADKTFKNR